MSGPLYYQKNREKIEAKRRELQRERMENGLCSKCGSHPLAKGRVRCEPCLSKLAEYRIKHADKMRANRRKHETVHHERRNSEKAARISEQKEKCFDHYGRICKCCGETEERFLTLDHVNNDGNVHREQIGRGTYTLRRWAISNNFPTSLQTLCWNCQMGKKFCGGTCPHQR